MANVFIHTTWNQINWFLVKSHNNLSLCICILYTSNTSSVIHPTLSLSQQLSHQFWRRWTYVQSVKQIHSRVAYVTHIRASCIHCTWNTTVSERLPLNSWTFSFFETMQALLALSGTDDCRTGMGGTAFFNAGTTSAALVNIDTLNCLHQLPQKCFNQNQRVLVGTSTVTKWWTSWTLGHAKTITLQLTLNTVTLRLFTRCWRHRLILWWLQLLHDSHSKTRWIQSPAENCLCTAQQTNLQYTPHTLVSATVMTNTG